MNTLAALSPSRCWNMKLPAVGSSVDFIVHECQFRVTRPRRDVYCLAAVPNGQRARFGTATEIRDDIDHVFLTGRLPGQDGARW